MASWDRAIRHECAFRCGSGVEACTYSLVALISSAP